MGEVRASRKQVARDCAALVLAAFLSAMPYVLRLGFYSDDWAFIAPFTFDGMDHLFVMFPGRPLQALYTAFLFDLFGTHPLGYHLTNMVVIAAAVVLFYLLLVRLHFRRLEAFAAALLLLLLPELSTMRAWISAAQISLSMALMFLSLHAQLSFARDRKMVWAALAAAAAVLSIAAYEIFAPLIFAFPLALLADRRRDRSVKLLAIGAAALLLAAIAYKIFASGRTEPIAEPIHYLRGLRKLAWPGYDWRTDSGLNIFAALQVHFWLTLKGWFDAIASVGRSGWTAFAVAVLITLTSAWRLLSPGTGGAERHGAARLLFVGIAVFILGHATFLLVSSIVFSPSGIGNRALVAAAIGVALILVGLVAVAAHRKRPAFAAAICLLVFCATLRIEEIESYWAEAPSLEDRVLTAARRDLGAVPAGSTVIIDGVCPYHGPAILFETSWDVAGALSMALGRQVYGDAVSPRMSIGPGGLHSSIYGEPSDYPYSPLLFVYNPNTHVVAQLPGAASARSYFHLPGRWPVRCPHGFPGHGVPV